MKKILFIAPFFLCSCAPTVHVSVPKPVVIDVNMKVDVTTRDGGTTGASPAKTSTAPVPSGDSAAEDHTRLMGEVQTLKDSRFIGEGKDGYLAVRNAPQGKLPTGEDYGVYTARIVKEENDARKAINMQTASKEGVPLGTVETESAERWRNAAFTGEWVQQPDGTWQQKGQK